MIRMSNSQLVRYTMISPNKSVPRNNSIKKVTIHHMGGNLSVENCGNVFASSSKEASSNYGIGTDGRVGMYVEEKDRSWCSSSPTNDHQAVTIEVANNSIGGNWPVSDMAYIAMIDLTVDICRRNGISHLIWQGNSEGTLTIHKFFANTTCPGPYLEERMGIIANAVNTRLDECRMIQEELYFQVNVLKKQGIINTPAYWCDNFQSIRYLGQLIIKIGRAEKNSSPIATISTPNNAIDHLFSRGLIGTPNYWYENYIRLSHLGEFLVATAKRIP
jgi:hypothetical protein